MTEALLQHKKAPLRILRAGFNAQKRLLDDFHAGLAGWPGAPLAQKRRLVRLEAAQGPAATLKDQPWPFPRA